MRRILLILFMSCVPILSLFADSYVTFWTNNRHFGNIRIYYNGSYAGTITHSYKSAPKCGASGCVTVRVSGTGNTWSAEADDGSEWTSDYVKLTSDCTRLLLHGTANSSGGGGGSSSGNYVPTYDYGDAAATAGAVIVIAAVAVGVVFAANDIYVSGVTSREYSGFNFGLRNSMDAHIDIEAGAGAYFRAVNPVMPASMATFYNFDRRDPYYEEKSKGTWVFDANVLYNFRARNMNTYLTPKWNIFAGVATSTILNPGYDFYKGGFGIGPVAGFSFGKGVKLELRYKILWNPIYEHRLFNQIELGMSVKYKKRFGFRN